MTDIMSSGKVKKVNGLQSERIALKISLLRRSWTYKDLARTIKVHPGYIANLFCGGNPWWPVRAAINRALGEQIFTKQPSSAISRPARRRPSARRSPAPAAASSPIPTAVCPPAAA